MPRILVADDNTNIQKMVALAFEERGIDVVSVGNGEAAVRRIPDLSPDLVLADVFMPVRNGYEVCEFVKKDERFSHVPVILLVGAFDPLDEKEARRVGADGVLKKPFVPPDPLIAMVTSALEKNPRIAAEMTKARETPTAPPKQPAAVLEAPARIEPTPLPEFPEPSPEEAAAVYGFGKGHGRSDDEAEEPAPPRDLAVTEAEGSEEEFDGSSTTTDWRRNASNFEVPEEVGSKFAFAPDDNFKTADIAAFPSESQNSADSSLAGGLDEARPADEAPSEPVSHTSTAQFAEKLPQDVVPIESANTQTDPVEAPAPEAATEPSPSEKSKFRNWMDSIASPSEYAEGGWVSAIFGNRAKDKAKETRATPLEDVASPVPAVMPATRVDSGETARPMEEQFNQTTEPQRKEVTALADPRTAPVDSWLSPPPPPVMSAHIESQRNSAAASSELSNLPGVAEDLIGAPAELPGSLRDPELEVSAAPHVTPEPLLVNDDEPSGSSAFSGASQPPEPVYSFLPPAPAEQPVETTVHGEAPTVGGFHGSIFAPQEPTQAMDSGPERIPTVPPPNWEALSDIAFLTPPAGATVENRPSAQDAPSVDAVVARVLQKLEPQLHELLSQGLLKPLVENLLQQELKKTER